MQKTFCLIILLGGFFFSESHGQTTQTVGLFTHTPGSVDDGYVLFSPLSSTTTYLIDKCGKLVHTWPSAYQPSFNVDLLPDGSILRPGINGEKTMIERIGWDGNVLWHYAVGDSQRSQHHDIQPLPNGNILVIENNIISRDASPTHDSVYRGVVLSTEEIVEYQPIGTDSAIIVWRWRALDHLVQDMDPRWPDYGAVANHPELINPRFPSTNGGTDWLHFNSVKYNAGLDQIVISVFNFSEIWVIDHHSTTAEAASHSGGARHHGGDLLYRWGNPQAYNHGTPSDQKLFSQHDAEWIAPGLPHAGRLIVFNNGAFRPAGMYSSIEVIAPPVDINGDYSTSELPLPPSESEWEYAATPPTDFFCPGGGGAQMLSNGNVLMCNASTGVFTEVDAHGSTVWEYGNPVSVAGPVAQGDPVNGTGVFRCAFYPASYSAFTFHEISAGAPIERNPLAYQCTLNSDTSTNHPPTVGLVAHESKSLDRGYVLFAPPNDSTYLINKCGKQVHVWKSTQPGTGFAHLLPNGNLLRAGHYQTSSGLRDGGATEILDWNGNSVWKYSINDSLLVQHDDVCMLPNGDVLCLVTELHSNVEALQLGRDSLPVSPWFRSEAVVELRPVGADSAVVVWKWRVWDHLIQNKDSVKPNFGSVTQHPELVNINYSINATQRDWLHINAIAFNPDLNLILLTVQNFGEVWMIEHTTTTQSAAMHSGGYHGRGGDLLYRWGNPAAYRRGLPSSKSLFGPCAAQWIPKGFPAEGNLIVFNTGLNRNDSLYSSVNIFSPALDSPGVHNTSTRPLGPDTMQWNYTNASPTSFYSPLTGSAQMLSNGNVLICEGTSGTFFEVNPSGGLEWRYIQPVNANGPVVQGAPVGNTEITSCEFYPFSYSGFAGKSLVAGSPIELNTVNYDCELNGVTAVVEQHPGASNPEMMVYPNPAIDHLTISSPDFNGTIALFNCLGERVIHTEGTGTINTAAIPAGVYVVVCASSGASFSKIVTVTK